MVNHTQQHEGMYNNPFNRKLRHFGQWSIDNNLASYHSMEISLEQRVASDNNENFNMAAIRNVFKIKVETFKKNPHLTNCMCYQRYNTHKVGKI